MLECVVHTLNSRGVIENGEFPAGPLKSPNEFKELYQSKFCKSSSESKQKTLTAMDFVAPVTHS